MTYIINYNLQITMEQYLLYCLILLLNLLKYLDSCCSLSNIFINETPSSHTLIKGENSADINHCLAKPQPIYIKSYFIFLI